MKTITIELTDKAYRDLRIIADDCSRTGETTQLVTPELWAGRALSRCIWENAVPVREGRRAFFQECDIIHNGDGSSTLVYSE